MALMDPYTGPWTAKEAAHLARRTTFGVTPDNLSLMVVAGMSVSVDSIVNYADVDTTLEDQIANLPASTENDRIKDPRATSHLEGWWLYRMVHSTQPFQQQFTLFLHDHFVSEWGKVQSNVNNRVVEGNDGSVANQPCVVNSGGLPPDSTREQRIIVRLFQDQQAIFRTIGHQGMRNLLIAITRDPCMLIYLDNRLNTKGKPQENYAREIMELFSMGVGNYSEEDVREVARALTGETIRTGCLQNWPYDYTYNSTQHDTGSKTVFGVTFTNQNNGSDTLKVIDLILNRISNSTISPAHSTYPATALYMSWKFITWFVNDSIPIEHPAVAELAHLFYTDSAGGYNYNVREVLRTLLKSQFFYDPENHLKVYKHPADFVVSALRCLELNDPGYASTVYSRLRAMGMRLFEPPNVAGWQHGRSWINSSSLIARFNYADRMSSSTVMSNAYINALITNGHVLNYNDDTGIINYFTTRLLQESATPDEVLIFRKLFNDIKGTATTVTQSIYYRKVRAALHLTMTMPRYQLK
jgi:uncharacterized protein (DUF1800 family)